MNKPSVKPIVLILCSLILSSIVNAQQYPFQNTNLSDDKRLDNLISLMTLDEKIGQMNMPCSYLSALGRSHEEKVEFAKWLITLCEKK